MKFFAISSAMIILSFFAACSHKKQVSENPSASIKKADDIHLEVHKKEFANGLRVIVYENHKLPILSYYTFFDVGGRYESKGTTGATHFLEHMMFKGAKKFGPGEFDTFIEKNGGDTNAYTSFDSTVYYQNLPSHTLETIIDMEADRIQHLLLEPTSFESERQVILEERKMRYENSPKGKLFLAMMKAVFENTPYGGSVIGDAEDVINLKRDQMMEFFKKFYGPNNAIIVIAGDVKAANVFQLFEKYFSTIPAVSGLTDYKKSLEKEDTYKFKGRYNREVHLNASTPTPMVALAYKGEPIGTRRGFVLDMLSSILGDGESSYLNKEFVLNKSPLANSISAMNYTLKNNGVFYIMGELLPKVSLNKFKSQLIKSLKNSCNLSINARSVQKTKNQYLLQYFGEINTNQGIAHFLGLRESFFNDYSYYKKELAIYQEITEEELRSTCEQLVKSTDTVYLSVWDKNK